MAGAGAKLFTSGSVLTADQVNTYLMDQTIMKFTSTTTRDAAFGGAGEPTLAEGMFAYTTDTNTLWLYDGSNWVNVLGSDIGNQALSNRNVIINGAMQVAQRGTSTAGITSADYYTADRWRTNIISLGTWTQSVEADAPTGSGFRNSLKMLCTTADASPAAADTALIVQRCEGQNVQQFLKGTASAKSFAVSFWVKSNVTGTYIANLIDNSNTRSVSASYTISASATWEKKTIIFPADTTGAFSNDNSFGLQVSFWLATGSNASSGTLNTTWATTVEANRAVGQTNLASAINNYWQVTGVQLEAGAVATPFEFEDYGTTLAKCQRYYWRLSAEGFYTTFTRNAIASSTTAAQAMFSLPVSMRVAASSVDSSNIALTPYAGTGLVTLTSATTSTEGSKNLVSINVGAASGLTTGTSYTLLANNNASAFIGFSAEL